MKSNIMKAVPALPFCVPVPFVLLVVDYYLPDELSFISTCVVSFLGVLSFYYYNKGKVPEMLAGDGVGFLISLIITFILNNSFDKSWFLPLTPITYLVLLALMFVFMQAVAIFIFIICNKIKNKIKKENK